MARIVIRRANTNADLAEYKSNVCPAPGDSFMAVDDSLWTVTHIIHRSPRRLHDEGVTCMVYVSPIPDIGPPMDLRPEGSRPGGALEAALDVGAGDA